MTKTCENYNKVLKNIIKNINLISLQIDFSLYIKKLSQFLHLENFTFLTFEFKTTDEKTVFQFLQLKTSNKLF